MSLRARLVAALVLVVAVVLAGAGVATSVVFSRSQLRQVDANLDRVSLPIETLALDGSPEARREIEQIAPGLFVARFGADGQVVFAISGPRTGPSPTNIGQIDPALTGPAVPDVRYLTITGATSDDTDGDDDGGSSGRLRLRSSSLSSGGSLAVGQPLHELDEARRTLVGIEIGVALVGLALATIAGALLVTIGLRPLRRIERAALDIAEEGQLDREVPGVDESTEVGRLALAMEIMLGRIRDAFAARDNTEAELRRSEENMRRLVADASHELRTPLAAVSAYAELFDRGARDRPEDLERAMHGISAETARMRTLIEDLLLLARLDEARPVAHDLLDLTSVVVDAIDGASAVAPESLVSADLPHTSPIRGDEARLRQVIDNLLANVRAHTPPGTHTMVRLRKEAALTILSVSDDGPGMGSDDTARAFERFHRADGSRSRGARTPSGSGLGLSIVAAILEAHGGTVTIDSKPGQGVTVEISLPSDGPPDAAVGHE